MSIQGGLKPRLLFVCIGTVLASSIASATDPTVIPSGSNLLVTNCDDDGPGSLRAVLATAARGDSIDLTQLTCSLITLTTGELSTDVDDLRLIGGNATISAGGAGRVLSHTGSGDLHAEALVIADGAVGGRYADGGCIASQGNLDLIGVTVRNCSASSSPAFTSFARGAGIYARGNVRLTNSSVLDNSISAAPGSYSYGRGAGVFAFGNITLEKSTISGNTITGPSVGYLSGGGFFSTSSLSFRYSTVSDNSAYFGGAGEFGYGGVSEIRNSTISGNSAIFRTGGLASHDGLLRVWNSTVVLNSAEGPGEDSCGAGIVAFGFEQYLSLRSSIVAMNATAGAEDDICINFSSGTPIVGFANIVLASNVPLPGDTIQLDPMLEMLSDNGGITRTHALLPGSPAIDRGDDRLLLPYD